LASAEYFRNRGDSANPAYLTALYQDILHRAVDPAGASTWGAILASGHAPNGGDAHTFVAYGILTSVEGSRDAVQAFYGRFLHRPADQRGLANWSRLIEQGTGSGAVIAGVVGSEEYFQRVTRGPSITIQSPANGSVADRNITILGQVTDSQSPVVSLTAAVDGGTPVGVPFDASGSFGFTTTLAVDGSADGGHVVHFQATDQAGAISSVVNLAFTLNTRLGAGPAIAIQSPANGGVAIQNVTVMGQVTDSQSAVASLSAAVDNGSAANVSFDASGNFQFTTML